MKRIGFLLIAGLTLLFSCGQVSEEKKVESEQTIPCYAWLGGPGNSTDEELSANFAELKEKGITGLMYNGGQDPATYERVGSIAKFAGLEFHTWIPTMLQRENPALKKEWYAVNRLGESAFEKPAYVDYYKFLCPSREEVYQFLENMYGRIADLPEVNGIHLDYIRFPDVILAEGLWEKYGLVMDREYPQYDYCYCDVCTGDFREKTGIDIKAVEDPSQVEEWKQFRYDLITGIVNRLADMVHSKNKEITAAVFPGPNSIAKRIVRQEWDKWNLDAFYPMNYNDFYLKGTAWIGKVSREAVDALNGRAPVYSGLFICPEPEKKASEPDPENHGLTPEELEPAIRESIENGAAGICLFTPGRMTKEHWQVFSVAIRKEYKR
jgi:uncharacterized lipoprotein YddW (UPF0748 family)